MDQIESHSASSEALWTSKSSQIVIRQSLKFPNLNLTMVLKMWHEHYVLLRFKNLVTRWVWVSSLLTDEFTFLGNFVQQRINIPTIPRRNPVQSFWQFEVRENFCKFTLQWCSLLKFQLKSYDRVGKLIRREYVCR